MKKVIFLMATAAIMVLTSCGSKKPAITTAAYHSYETECMGKDMDGKQTLKVWAAGKSRADALKQARKKAVYDIVFTGITAGSGECNSYPVVDEANARQKYQDYFDKFFADNGPWRKFVDEQESRSDADQFRGDGNQTWGIVVKVDRPALRKRLVKDKIIK